MTPATITLIVFLIALALFIADFLPMGLVVFSVPVALYFCGIIEAKDFFKPGIALSALAFALSMILLPLIYPFFP